MAGKTPNTPENAALSSKSEKTRHVLRHPTWSIVLWTGVTAALLFVVLDRASIPPLVSSDYCYLFQSVDRFGDGQGFTALPPTAPGQPWEWRDDWVFLTQWPVGYPALIVAIRWVTGMTTLEAAQLLGILACAAGLVGWFAWLRRMLPPGVAGVLLALIAAVCPFSPALLLNPSTDVLVVAAIPYLGLLLCSGTGEFGDRLSRRAVGAGLLAGMLLWVRYAAVFVPIGLAAFFLVAPADTRRSRVQRVGAFLVSAAIPIVILILVNRLAGSAVSPQEQFNLGVGVGFSASPRLPVLAWWTFTDLGFYNHHAVSHWLFTLWPFLLLTGIALTRRPTLAAVHRTSVVLAICLTVSLLLALVMSTALFGAKYEFVSLERYYLPIRPLYFLLFVSPLLRLRSRIVTGVSVAGMVMIALWMVEVDWWRAGDRMATQNRERSAYGQWSRCFLPDADRTYDWIRRQTGPDLVVLSNFHEYVALETGIPALPIPEDTPTLHRWLDRIRRRRAVGELRVLFVLDPSNRWRDYWIPPVERTIRVFGLNAGSIPADAPGRSALVFEYADHRTQDAIAAQDLPAAGG